MYERAVPQSRTDFVYEAIRDEILGGALPPGHPLVEADLAEGFGVSKTPVREALKLLAGSGLVTISNYKGAVVRLVDAELVRSVFDLRALLEPEAPARSVRLGADFLLTAGGRWHAGRHGNRQHERVLRPVPRRGAAGRVRHGGRGRWGGGAVRGGARPGDGGRAGAARGGAGCGRCWRWAGRPTRSST